MGRKKKEQIKEAEIDEVDDDEEDEVQIPQEEEINLDPQWKAERFFNEFCTIDDYTIQVYRLGERNKRTMVTKFENFRPDPINDIQLKFGGGTYVLYASRRITLPNGKDRTEFLDSVQFHLADPPKEEMQGNSKAAVIEDMKAMKELFGGGQQMDQTLIIKMMEMSQASERRMTEMIMKMSENMNSQKSSLKEALETFTLLDEIRGSAPSGDGGMLDMVKTFAPMVAPLAGKLLESSSPILQPKTNTPEPTAIPIKTEEQTIDEIIGTFPENLLRLITIDSRDKSIDLLYENNKSKMNKDFAVKIVDRIIEVKRKLSEV